MLGEKNNCHELSAGAEMREELAGRSAEGRVEETSLGEESRSFLKGTESENVENTCNA